MKVQCLPQKFTSCCIARDLNKNSQFAGHVQIKLPWIPEVTGCSLVGECHRRSQLLEVEPKHCCKNLTSHRISQNSDWMRKTTGCLTEPEVPFFRFSRGLRNPG